MNDDPRARATFLEVPGQAADHLYREGSAKASFWEAVFGSSLRAKNRTHVCALPDGTRMFDVPLLALEPELLRRAHLWITAKDSGSAGRLPAQRVRVRLIGLQPCGQAVAAFTLRFEPEGPTAEGVAPEAAVFRSWFAAEGERIAQEVLIPFGFTPERG